MNEKPKSSLRPYLPIIILIALNLLLTTLFIGDYGETWDDNSLYLYGEDTVDAYFRGLTNRELTQGNLGPFNLRYYGPVYYATVEVASQPLEFFGLNLVDRWHLVNFVGFQLTILFLYLLCRRVMSTSAAFASVLLFETQPLIWGHAIINPKDMPFMTLFLGTIVMGLVMVDHFLKNAPKRAVVKPPIAKTTSQAEWGSTIREEWRALSQKTKWILATVIGFAILVVAGLYLGEEAIKGLLEGWVQAAYTASPLSLLGRVFHWVAPNASQVDVSSYIRRSHTAFLRLQSTSLILLPLVLMGLSGLIFKSSRTQVTETYIRPLFNWIKAYVPGYTLLAGVVLGTCTAIRILGPAAGGLVAIYFVWKAGFKSIPALLAYSLSAGLVTYLGWPYLWEAPISRFWEVLQLMSDFPGVGSVLFGGQLISPMELPQYYLITLLGLQFTIPAIGLFLLGITLAVLRVRRGAIDRPFVLLLALWFVLPVIIFTLSPPRLYDNFRQLLFLLPPVFVFCGLALDEILQRINSRVWRLSATGLLILPGVVWIVLLHPYQYVFYNALIGGTSNAYSRYEMDYWVTSFQETAEYLNEQAPENAQVIVFGPEHIVKRAAREDLVFAQDILNQGGEVQPDYAVMTTRHNWHLENYPDAPVVFEVGRFGAVFAVVKYVGNGN